MATSMQEYNKYIGWILEYVRTNFKVFNTSIMILSTYIYGDGCLHKPMTFKFCIVHMNPDMDFLECLIAWIAHIRIGGIAKRYSRWSRVPNNDALMVSLVRTMT